MMGNVKKNGRGFSFKYLPAELWILLIWLLTVLLVNPLGEFPVNDDWAYSKNVWHLVENGELYFSDWPGMTLFSQTLIGAGFTTIFGFSFSALRILTLIMGIASILLVFRFLLNTGIRKRQAFFTSVVLMFSPLFLALSFTFMTEIYFYFFTLLALLFYYQYLSGGRGFSILLCSFFILVAMLIRQTALIIPLAILLVEILRPQLNLKRILFSTIPLLITLSGYLVFVQWLDFSGNMSGNFGRAGELFMNLRNNKPDYFISKAGTLLMYPGLFLLPLTFRYLSDIRLPGSWPVWMLWILVLALLALFLAMGFSDFPVPNVFYNLGIGPRLLRDSYWGNNISPVLSPALWTCIRILAAGGALLLGVVLLGGLQGIKFRQGWMENPRNAVKIFLAVILGGILFYIELNRFFFDRYTMVVILLAALLLTSLPVSRPGRIGRIASLLVFALIALFSIAAVRDFMEWSRTRWKALDYLVDEKGVNRRMIDGGLEFNGWFETGPFNPSNPDEKSWWFVTEDEYVVSWGPIDGFQHYASFPYYRYLFPGRDSIQVLWHPIEGMIPYDVYPIQVDCETLDHNPEYLLSRSDSIRFEGGKNRSREHARSGQYSVKLTADSKFAFLHRFKEVRPGERFVVRIWKYGGDDMVTIVAGAAEGCGYASQDDVSATDASGWQLLELSLELPDDIDCYRYAIFLWNAGGAEVWLDDLEITRIPAGGGEPGFQE